MNPSNRHLIEGFTPHIGDKLVETKTGEVGRTVAIEWNGALVLETEAGRKFRTHCFYVKFFRG